MSVTTILFKQGITVPSGSSFSGTNGEPLWDSQHQKLYVTNGTTSPKLIGPIDQVQSDWTNQNPNSPAFILHKPNFEDIDRNDNLKFLKGHRIFKDGTGNPAYGIGATNEMEKPYTQYTIDLEYFYNELNGAPFINLYDIETSISDGTTDSKKKKATFYLEGMEYDDGYHWWNQSNMVQEVPLFWYAKADNKDVAVQGKDFFINYWVNGSKVIDGMNLGEVTFTNWFSLYEGDNVWKLLGNSRRMKVEIWHTYDGNSAPVFEINITWPVISSIVISNSYNQQSGTLIATVNGVPIYGPNVVSGQSAIGGDYGIENLSAFTLRASLADYNARNINTDPLTPVVLNSTVGGKLYVNEKSPFVNGFNGGQGQIDASASYSNGTLSWQPSSYGRSYRSFIFDSNNISGNSTNVAVTLAASLDSVGTHTDHYILIANQCVGKSITVTFSFTGGQNTFNLKCIPPITVIRPGYSVEVSLVTKADKEMVNNVFTDVRTVAAMTASEPLQIVQ